MNVSEPQYFLIQLKVINNIGQLPHPIRVGYSLKNDIREYLPYLTLDECVKRTKEYLYNNNFEFNIARIENSIITHIFTIEEAQRILKLVTL